MINVIEIGHVLLSIVNPTEVDMGGKHTSEKMILETSARHELIDQQPMFIFQAVSYQFYEIGVAQLTQVIDFCLQILRSSSKLGHLKP